MNILFIFSSKHWIFIFCLYPKNVYLKSKFSTGSNHNPLFPKYSDTSVTGAERLELGDCFAYVSVQSLFKRDTEPHCLKDGENRGRARVSNYADWPISRHTHTSVMVECVHNVCAIGGGKKNRKSSSALPCRNHLELDEGPRWRLSCRGVNRK